MKIESSKLTLSDLKSILLNLEEKIGKNQRDEVIIELEYGTENFLFSQVQPRLVVDVESKKKKIVISITRDI
ncbi:MAG: hypothetical protein CBC42_00895 [Betaproteobacteria bacterium TMED82]|jgi:hypothetical protein|nr:MAG: hypothetical protein CBC42_00895 [Betaproteobacteria bacterium TMED82]|tara:strand:+ start:11477 stop:11692 length:216 start_codon:yes stop_codon:yes gene_type:complete